MDLPRNGTHLDPPLIGQLIRFHTRSSRHILNDDRNAALATVVFAVLWHGFSWGIAGGGLTRSLGLLFAVLTIDRTFVLYTTQSRNVIPQVIALGSLTILSHLETAWFAAFSGVMLFLTWGRNRRALIHSIIVTLGIIAATAPWWLTIVSRHGFAPFLRASDHGSPVLAILLAMLFLDVTREPYVPIIRLFFLVGAFCAWKQHRFILVWFVSIPILDPRMAFTPASIPLAMIAALGISAHFVPLIRRITHSSRTSWFIIAVALGFSAWQATVTGRNLIAPLALEERKAMRWIAAETPSHSRVLVISGDYWPQDRSSEWMPSESGRLSVATVQGHEWQPDFLPMITKHAAVQRCASLSTYCIDEWLAKTGQTFDYLYVARRPTASDNAGSECCRELLRSLDNDIRYRLVHETTAARIYRFDFHDERQSLRQKLELPRLSSQH